MPALQGCSGGFLLRYNAKVRLKKGPNTEIKNFKALDIHEAAEVVRAKYGLDTDKPHRGFVITEVVE